MCLPNRLLHLFLPALLAAGSLFAQTSQTTTPAGCVVVTLSAATGGVPRTSTFSPALRLKPGSSFTGKIRGTLTAVSATTLTDSSAGWTAAALSQTSQPYFIRLRSGTVTGSWWQVSSATANTATTLTLLTSNQSLTGLGIAAGDTYEIVPAYTLSTLFSGLEAQIGGSSSDVADTVQLHDGVNWREYFYNTSAGQWREGSSTFNRGSTVVRPETGVVFTRKGATTLNLLVLGTISDARERVLVPTTGVTPVGSVFPVARTLSSLSLQSMPGFATNSGTLSAADKVRVFDGTNWRSFNYNASASQWREGSGSTDLGSFALPFGAPVILERGSAASGSASLLILDPPYSL